MLTNSTKKHIVVGMLCLFMAINFADKAIIGLAAVRIMKDLNIGPAQFGLIGSAFFLLFSISAIIVGFIANRVKSFYILIVLALVWSVAQLPLVFAASFQVLIISRIVLGMGEGPAFPMALHAAYKWFKNDERNLPSSIVQQGVNIGLMMAGPVLTYIILKYDWRSAFFFLSVVGFVWVIAWSLLGGEGTINSSETTTAPVDKYNLGFMDIALDSTSIGVLLIYFIEYAVIALYFTWLPSYLRLGLGFSPTDTGWLFAVITGSWIPLTILFGWVAQLLKSSGYSSRIARGLMCSTAAAAGGIIFMMLSLQFSPAMKVAFVAVGGVLAQTIFSFGPLIMGEISPESQRGGVFGILSGIGTLGGIIAPFVMGQIIQSNVGDPALGYQRGYFLVGILLVAIGLAGAFLINPERSTARFTRLARQAVKIGSMGGSLGQS